MTMSSNGGKHRAGPQTPMSLERLRAVLDAYGASPNHWPQTERTSADALIDASPEARAMVAAAAQLDALLDLVQPPAPSAALAQRLQGRRFGWRGLRAVAWGETLASHMGRWMTSPKHQVAAVAGALVFGLLLGAEINAGDQPVVTTGHVPARIATATYGSNPQLLVEGSQGSNAATALYQGTYSSNGDPAFDAPDPFGAASHGMDLVEGARLTSVPVPNSGEPLGAIPLL
jgi:hypothetical protein